LAPRPEPTPGPKLEPGPKPDPKPDSGRGGPPAPGAAGAPGFDAAFQARLAELFAWRRDVRRFRRDPVPAELVESLLRLAHLAPSVGLSQPWRFVLVEDPARRQAVRTNFEAANAEALAAYKGERARHYAGLKLAGLDEAPVHIAAFCVADTMRGHGLGRRTMPEMLAYSAVMAAHTLWLAARAHGIGLGWVSIFDPDRIANDLDVPRDWRFIGYLCLGYPQEATLDPELQRAGWEHRDDPGAFILRR
jgi:5,6-dimethylbenzimidazole synthase